MSFFKEFKEFAVKGNVIDLAVGVIIGGAFQKIVSSLVADIITPPLGLLIGGLNFKNLNLAIKPPIGDHPPVVLTYGNFIQNSIDFVIVALTIFLVIKLFNSLRRKKAADATPPPPPPAPTKEELLLTEIRDILKNQKSAR